MNKLVIMTLGFPVFYLAACMSPPASDSKSPATSEQETAVALASAAAGTHQSMSPQERREFRAQATAARTESLERTAASLNGESRHDTGEVPDELMQKVIDDLVTKNAAARSAVKVLRAESVVWNDGSLGCGKPGQNYTHALVPGYRIILEHGGQQFDYRATEHGSFLLCEQPTLALPGAGAKPPVQ